ncbi:MAG: hypothetical protein ACTHQQ_11245, partial [Solirubrobacteraceae bacterium]
MTSEGPPVLTRRAVAARVSIRGERLGGVARPLFLPTLHALIPLAILGGWALSIRDINLARVTDLGLVSALPHVTIALLFVLAVSFSLSLTRRPLGAVVPLIHVLALIVMLFGLTTFIEPVPRFAAAWRFVGLIGFVSGHQAVTPPIDAFFNWPGFLALGSVIVRAAGWHSELAILGWGPIVFNLLFLPPLLVIFRWASDDRRVRWLGVWVFYSANWVGQDYMSDQAIAYLLWLVMLAALLTWFTPRPSGMPGAVTLRSFAHALNPRLLWSRWHPSTDRALVGGATYQRVLILLLVLVMYGATVTGHQLTPVPAILVAIGLVTFANLETRLLPAIMIVLLAAWIAYMTTSYLSGHFAHVFGALGQVGSNVTTSVSGRVVGSSGHQFITRFRIVMTVATLALAAAGVVRRVRTGRTDVAMYVVGGAAFLLPALQAYGGEVALRVVLFSLPAVSFFIATLAFPSPTAGRSWLVIAIVAIAACGLLASFQYTRYGNERFEAFTRGDMATTQAFYRLAPRGSTVYAGNSNYPLKYRDYAGYHYRTVDELSSWNAARPNTTAVARQLRRVLDSAGGYVMVTRSMKMDEAVEANQPLVLDRLVRDLR